MNRLALPLLAMLLAIGPAWPIDHAVAQPVRGGPLLGGPAPGVAPDSAADSRLLDILQLDAKDKAIGDPVQIACPSSGCQTPLKLTFEGRREPFLLSVQFVGRGAYVTLASRSIGIAEVQEFEQGHKGAIFVPIRTPGRLVVRMELIVVPAASVRALDQGNDGQVLASGNVFNRKRTPDLVLRLEFSPPGG